MKQLKGLLEKNFQYYNNPDFIATDPISVPHRFTKKQDIEIAGFFAAVFAWGGRPTIINKTNELMKLMQDQPHAFILQHSDEDLKKLLPFKHRTFNTTDLLYFIDFLKHHYSQSDSLETAFTRGLKKGDKTIENALNGFHDYFFSLEDSPLRTRKHIASPARGSTCKRLNMYLRWMVRMDDRGVDFGLWKKISPAQLICPIDVHVSRIARELGFLTRNQNDWLAALELTENLRKYDKNDPVKYDFALFGMGSREA